MERILVISFILLGMFKIPYNAAHDETAWFVLAIVALLIKPSFEWIGKKLNKNG